MANEDFIYRISTEQEWQEFQKNGSSFGGELDKSTGCFHLSKLHQVIHLFLISVSKKFNTFMMENYLSDSILQVQMTLQNFFLNAKEDLYLLQIDPKKVCCWLYIYHLIWHIHVGLYVWLFCIKESSSVVSGWSIITLVSGVVSSTWFGEWLIYKTLVSIFLRLSLSSCVSLMLDLVMSLRQFSRGVCTRVSTWLWKDGQCCKLLIVIFNPYM